MGRVQRSNELFGGEGPIGLQDCDGFRLLRLGFVGEKVEWFHLITLGQALLVCFFVVGSLETDLLFLTKI